MSRRRNSLGKGLAALPWWLFLVFAAVAYWGLTQWLPSMAAGNMLLKSALTAYRPLAYLSAGMLVLLAVVSAYHGWHKGELLESQTSLETLRSVSWKDFEFLVSEAYRRQGFRVEERGAGGPDGGVDLVLRKEGRKTFVQCKRWRERSVGVSIVRELFGVMAAEGADQGIVVTTGDFSAEANDFVRGKALGLIDGSHLLQLISKVQQRKPSSAESPEVPLCPKCDNVMVIRVARQGKNAGSKFWGCRRFPACHGTRSIGV